MSTSTCLGCRDLHDIFYEICDIFLEKLRLTETDKRTWSNGYYSYTSIDFYNYGIWCENYNHNKNKFTETVFMDNKEYSTDVLVRLRRDQLVTVEDLQNFKTELLNEIRKLLPEVATHSQKKWLKSKDVRKLLSLSPGSLQNLRINGTLPFVKLGGVLYYNAEDVNKMMQKLL